MIFFSVALSIEILYLRILVSYKINVECELELHNYFNIDESDLYEMLLFIMGVMHLIKCLQFKGNY